MSIYQPIEFFLFLYFGLFVSYIFIFSFISIFRVKRKQYIKGATNRIAVIIPSYQDDMVIFDSVESVLKQNYSTSHFDIYVIADKMKQATVDRLKLMQVNVIEVYFDHSTKAKSLCHALQQLDGYDIAVVLDSDNVCDPDFLNQINNAFNAGAKAVQAHRKAKNLNTNFALLDAMSEEINNSLFRKSQSMLGFSAQLIGSGLAIDFNWLKDNISKVESVGEDKELDFLLVKDKIRIQYLNDVEVFDEKVQKKEVFYNQRRRWLSAQYYHLTSNLQYLLPAVKAKNWDLCNRFFQMFMLPRVLLLGFILIMAIIQTIIDPVLALKWYLLFVVLSISLFLAVPRYLISKRLFIALSGIPVAFLMMFLNLFRIKGGAKRFIHTEHGIEE